jgi:predicted DNA-binding transcriptional regulator
MEMSSNRLSAKQIRFIDDLAGLLSAWSLSTNAARLYGYLQITNVPVSLEEIARDLEISRSHAHSAAKMLEDHGNARGVAIRGSRRILYVCGDDPGMPLQKQVMTLGRMSALIAGRALEVAEGEASIRLIRLASFHKKLQEAMEAVVRSDYAREVEIVTPAEN